MTSREFNSHNVGSDEDHNLPSLFATKPHSFSVATKPRHTQLIRSNVYSPKVPFVSRFVQRV